LTSAFRYIAAIAIVHKVNIHAALGDLRFSPYLPASPAQRPKPVAPPMLKF
jgi:hypothetical protein